MTHALRWIFLALTELLYTRFAIIYDPVSAIVSAGQWGKWRECALYYVDGDDVLELGFGTGHLVLAISGSDRRGYGLDASPAMTASAANKLRSHHCRANILQGLAQHLPFAEGRFDSIVSTFPAAYILDRKTISECARVARKPEQGAAPCRLIVVGLWVQSVPLCLRLLFAPFYGEPDWNAVGAYTSSLQRAKFSPAIVEHRIGKARVGTILAVIMPE